MHRLLVDFNWTDGAPVHLSADASRHLRVLRPKKGEAVELFDGAGRWQECRWDGAALVASGELHEAERPAESLTLFACVTKGSRWDWTIEKATELGVTRIVPVISERTIVRIPRAERAAKRERWMRIAADAARQSDAKWLPEIDCAVDFQDALEIARGTTCFVGALTTPPPPPLASVVSNVVAGSSVSAFVGPEGDFSPSELSALCEFAHPASFGPTVLRAETAAIFAVSVLVALCRHS